MHNLGKNQSEKARKEIESEFGLVKAQSSKQTNKLKIDSVNFPRICMANRKQKRAIANVLMKVIPQYKFVSLSVLNAVLKLYNITADRGERDSRIYKIMDSLIGYWMRRKINRDSYQSKFNLYETNPGIFGK